MHPGEGQQNARFGHCYARIRPLFTTFARRLTVRAALYPVASALVIFVLVTCVVSVLAVHLFHVQDEWNFGGETREGVDSVWFGRSVT